MDMGELFRGLLGIRKRRFEDSDPPYRDNRRSTPLDDEDDYEDGSDIDVMMDSIFQHFHGNMQQQMDQLNQEMAEIFQNFGSVDFTMDVPQEHKALPAPENPRDHMLKSQGQGDLVPHPHGFNTPSLFGELFSNPFGNAHGSRHKVDKDLDSEVKEKGLLNILKEDGPQKWSVAPQPHQFFSGRSVSITTIRGADGKVEHRKTVRDSDGNEETTVTRQVGDQSHTIKTKKDQFGVVKENETFNNTGDKQSFNKTWEDRESCNPVLDLRVVPRVEQEDRSIFKRLFGFDFNGRNNGDE